MKRSCMLIFIVKYPVEISVTELSDIKWYISLIVRLLCSVISFILLQYFALLLCLASVHMYVSHNLLCTIVRKCSEINCINGSKFVFVWDDISISLTCLDIVLYRCDHADTYQTHYINWKDKVSAFRSRYLCVGNSQRKKHPRHFVLPMDNGLYHRGTVGLVSLLTR